jgi:hypothetical protein
VDKKVRLVLLGKASKVQKTIYLNNLLKVQLESRVEMLEKEVAEEEVAE